MLFYGGKEESARLRMADRSELFNSVFPNFLLVCGAPRLSG